MAAAEQKKSYEVVKQFKGVNTKANRTAIGDDEFYWLENAMPIGYGNLKITPTYSNVGNVTFTSTVTYYQSANIGLIDYLIAFETDGSAEYVRLDTNAKGTIGAAGTFSSRGVNISQWKNDRILIADPAKGYFTWDGTNLSLYWLCWSDRHVQMVVLAILQRQQLSFLHRTTQMEFKPRLWLRLRLMQSLLSRLRKLARVTTLVLPLLLWVVVALMLLQ
jgi:hypothetical protein